MQEIFIITILMWVFCIFVFIELIQQSKKIRKISEDEEKDFKELEKARKKERRLKEIMLNSRRTKENYFKTIEKIERELFYNNSQF